MNNLRKITRMKKLLAIVVLGLLLASCSEYTHNKEIKKIQKCADTIAIKNNGVVFKTNDGKKIIGFLSDELMKRDDPLGLFEDEKLKDFNKMPLKRKLSDKVYEKIWSECESEFRDFPVKFKAKYLK